jgi:hypothetical protein
VVAPTLSDGGDRHLRRPSVDAVLKMKVFK